MAGRPKIQIAPGDRFGRYIILTSAPKKYDQRQWLCRCDCGTVRSVNQQPLTSGQARSCGCLKREVAAAQGKAKVRHGESVRQPRHSAEYRIWSAIIARCENPNNPAFPGYGGRGIRVHLAWRTSYERFLMDVGRRPSAAHSLDRYPDNDGSYEPGNVRWSTRSEQARNARRNRWIEFAGERLLLCEWAQRTGIKSSTIAARIGKQGWSIERALTEPTGRRIHVEA